MIAISHRGGATVPVPNSPRSRRFSFFSRKPVPFNRDLFHPLWCTKGAGWLLKSFCFHLSCWGGRRKNHKTTGPEYHPASKQKKKGPTRPRSLAPRSGIREPFAAIYDYGDHLPNEANYRATNRGGDAFDFVGAMIDRGFGWMIELIEDVVFHDRFENH